MVYCPKCGASAIDGLAFCEECNAPFPRTLTSTSAASVKYNGSQNTTLRPEISSQPAAKSPISPPAPTPLICPVCRSKATSLGCQNCGWKPEPTAFQQRQPTGQSLLEVVARKPALLNIREILNLLLAWGIIFLGFGLRRVMFRYDSDITSILIETGLFIVVIFGVWFLLDKVSCRYFRLYTEFRFDASRALFAFIASIIFIGIPPGYNKYRVVASKPPKVTDIPKIQTFVLGGLLVWGVVLLTSNFWIKDYYVAYHLETLFLVPFVIALSVGVNLLPFYGSPGSLVFASSKVAYYSLAALTALLFFTSLPFLNSSVFTGT